MEIQCAEEEYLDLSRRGRTKRGKFYHRKKVMKGADSQVCNCRGGGIIRLKKNRHQNPRKTKKNNVPKAIIRGEKKNGRIGGLKYFLKQEGKDTAVHQHIWAKNQEKGKTAHRLPEENGNQKSEDKFAVLVKRAKRASGGIDSET